MTRRRAGASIGAALFFALLAATLVVATLVVRARTPDLVLEVTSITPREFTVGRDEGTRIAFFVREGDSAAEVSIVRSDARVVRTLASAAPLVPKREVVYRWDGRDDRGQPARAGSYRFRVVLPARDRDMVWPRQIAVRTHPSGAERALREVGP